MQREQDSSHSPVFVALFGLFLTCLVVSNTIAGKLIEVAGIVSPAGVIIFPVTYILGDVFTEVYGFKKTRFVIWSGFAANLVMSLFYMAAIALPSPAFFEGTAAYATVLGMAPRVVVASLIAYWAGEFGNSVVLSMLKKKTKGQHLWLRTIGSTVVGQGLDTVIFIAIAFAGSMPLSVLLSMILAQYLFKVAYEAIFTPLTYLVVRKVKKAEGIDVYDSGVRYNPFGLKE